MENANTIEATYKNTNNGGFEKVQQRNDGTLWINSDFGKGFMGWVKVSHQDLMMALQWTSAPEYVVKKFTA